MSLDKLMQQNLEFLEKIKTQSPLDAFEVKDNAFGDTERQRRIKASESNYEGLAQRREEVLQSFDAALAAEKAEIDRLQNIKSNNADTAPLDKPEVKAKTNVKKR